MHVILGKKQSQTQMFLQDGTRVPVTIIEVKDNPVTAVKTMDRNGYVAVQLGQGIKKNAAKPQMGHAKKGANLNYAPNFLREVRFPADTNIEELPKIGETIAATTVFEAGDIVDVTGKSKGKGFAGGVKRFHFKGGPRTHGQSDRERAPGSIGQTTTPGRVYKGKRMAGKMGNDTVTLKNLEVIEVTADGVFIKGLVPGIPGSYVVIKKVGKNKKHVGLLKEEAAQPAVSVESKQEKVEEQPQEPAQQAAPEEQPKTPEAPQEEVKSQASETPETTIESPVQTEEVSKTEEKKEEVK